jgi:hypothetical protein
LLDHNGILSARDDILVAGSMIRAVRHLRCKHYIRGTGYGPRTAHR